MKRIGVIAPAIVAGVLGIGAAQAQSDLVYTYRSTAELPVLKVYDQQPYWRGLAECAGMHGVLANRYAAAGLTEPSRSARERGVVFLKAARQRLMSDRSVTEEQASQLTDPAVDAGRGSAENLLRTALAKRDRRHEQIIDGMCQQLAGRHADAVRWSSR